MQANILSGMRPTSVVDFGRRPRRLLVGRQPYQSQVDRVYLHDIMALYKFYCYYYYYYCGWRHLTSLDKALTDVRVTLKM